MGARLSCKAKLQKDMVAEDCSWTSFSVAKKIWGQDIRAVGHPFISINELSENLPVSTITETWSSTFSLSGPVSFGASPWDTRLVGIAKRKGVLDVAEQWNWPGPEETLPSYIQTTKASIAVN